MVQFRTDCADVFEISARLNSERTRVMAREIERLSALAVKHLIEARFDGEGKHKNAGRHNDGDGLYLQIDPDGSCSWVFMWKISGRRRVMGLGSARSGQVSLKQARAFAKAAREIIRKGGDPIAERNAKRAETAGSMTFGQAATDCGKVLEQGWRSAKHKAQWLSALQRHAKLLLNKPVGAITTEHVVDVLKPLWNTQPVLAQRLRQRIERVMDWAKAKRLYHGDNPAAWEGNLQDWMPKPVPAKIRIKPMAALPYAQIPAFMASLRAVPGVCARALEFTILTAARTGETFGATWDELDFDEAVWTIPGRRMKAGVEHFVPLSDQAMQIVRAQYDTRSCQFVFPGRKDDKPLSNSVMLEVLRKLAPGLTVHGFRSSFRNWAEDKTTYHREAEFALAHTVGNKSERSYRHSTAFDKRVDLMNAWAAYCGPAPQADNVIAMRKKPIPA
jgi:integrase